MNTDWHHCTNHSHISDISSWFTLPCSFSSWSAPSTQCIFQSFAILFRAVSIKSGLQYESFLPLINNAGNPRWRSEDTRISEVLRGGCKGYDKQPTPNTKFVVKLLFEATSAATRAPIERPINKRKFKIIILQGAWQGLFLHDVVTGEHCKIVSEEKINYQHPKKKSLRSSK